MSRARPAPEWVRPKRAQAATDRSRVGRVVARTTAERTGVR